MPNHAVRVEAVFKALSDPTRRAVVERLGSGPASTSELVAPFSMAMPSFLQHLDVLERSGVVQSTKQGRVRTFQLTRNPFAPAEHWLGEQHRLWERRLDQLDAHLISRKERP